MSMAIMSRMLVGDQVLSYCQPPCPEKRRLPWIQEKELTPDVQIIRTSQRPLRRIVDIQEISINIMLHHESAGIKPVIKDLAAHNVPAHAPAVLIALVPQPIMAQYLRIVVVRLKATVVHVRCTWTFKEEEAVVINLFIALVKTKKDCDVLTGLVVDEL